MTPDVKRQLRDLGSIVVAIFIIWSGLLAFSLYKDLDEVTQKNQSFVLIQAKNSFEKNILFRRWVAMHGGVYVHPTKQTPPNPYLDFLENRDIETTEGEQLTLMNPAYVIKQFFENFPGSNGEVGHITSLKLLNPQNQADAWEKRALKRFESRETLEHYEFMSYKGEPHLRYIKALEVAPSCLKCHEKQGYKVGDIRGGITINLPTRLYDKIAAAEYKNLYMTYLLIWMVGTITIVLSYMKLRSSIEKEAEITVKLQAREEMLHQQAKMASMGEMIGNIAHQWRQPLSVITTLASSLKINQALDMLDEKEVNRVSDGISLQADYLSNTIEDFRNFFKKDKESTYINSNEVVTKIFQILSAKLKNRSIIVEQNIESVDFVTLENEFIQAVMNIISNAIDILEHKEHDKVIRIALYEENRELVITIQDNGGGIDEEIILRVFEPYFTTKHQSQGTGIGLYMTHEIITKNLNGKIDVENNDIIYQEKTYQGACFTIRIPIS